MNEERQELVNALAPVSLNTRNPFDLTYEEALSALVSPSHFSEDVNPDKAYMFLMQYKDSMEGRQDLLEGLLNSTLRVLEELVLHIDAEDRPAMLRYINKVREAL